MAWRLSRYQTFVANVTTITAAFLNAVQDAVVDIFNGNYSLKKLVVDGVGDAAASYAVGVIAKFSGGEVTFTGAASGVGLRATGGSTATGGVFIGGSSSGAAIQATGGASNGIAIEATGDGTGQALYATGGDSDGTAITAIGGATNGNAIRAEGTGTGLGLSSNKGITADTGDITATAGSVHAGNDVQADRHYIAGGSAPTISANANLGTGGAATIDGNSHDCSHQVFLESGTTTANGDLAEITFANTFGGVGIARVIAMPCGDPASFDDSKLRGVYCRKTAGNKYIIGCDTGIADNKDYLFSVVVIAGS